MSFKAVDFRVQIRTLMERKKIKGKKITIAKLARHPDVDLNVNTLYAYLQGRSEMIGSNIAKVLNVLHSL